MADLIVSHEAEDRLRVQPLITGLETEGFRVWRHTHIRGGAHSREGIHDHVDVAKCLAGMSWTKWSIGHDGRLSRDDRMPAKRRRFYVAVRLDSVDSPLDFGEVQTSSFNRCHGDRSDPRLLALADAVRECVTDLLLALRGQAVARRT